ncbi:hypothetical protein N7512_003462 [Penicillium capsulatum]|nr:hypothetical protein N7512_003462 [Penicillium capsulatum]
MVKMPKMRLPSPSGGNLGRTKNMLHFGQAFIIFIAWALTIAIWTKGDGIDGRTVFYWILCWISLPALVYLAAVPMWPRARRFGNVYAFATVDLVYTVFWFSAWVCLASDKDKSKTTRANHDKSSKGSCSDWAYGSEVKCNISTATTIIGVVIFLLFLITTLISFRNVMHFRRTGTLPDAVSDPTFAAQSKAAFSSNPAHDFEEDEDDFRSGRGGMAASSRGDRDEDYALLQQSEVDDLGNPNGRSAMHGAYDPTGPAPGGGGFHDYNTGYGGAQGQHYSETAYTPSDYGSTVGGYGHGPGR